MKSQSGLHLEVLGIAAALAAVTWVAAPAQRSTATPPEAIQLAQEFAEPIGEEDGQIGGPTMYGEDVGSAPIGGPTMYGEDVGSALIGGPTMYGEPVGSGPVGGPMVGGGPVESGDDGDPIGGQPLY